jgi:hypothetical protein
MSNYSFLIRYEVAEMTLKITQLEISAAVEDFARQHGAVFTKENGWHYVGDVPVELEEFFIQTHRDLLKSVATVFCPKCGVKVKLELNANCGGVSLQKCRCISEQKNSLKTDWSEHATITKNEKNRILNLINELQLLAIKQLKTSKRINEWLTTPKTGLEGKRPIDMLSNVSEIKKVRKLLLELHL